MLRSAEKAQEAAREFVMTMRPEDQIGMIMFADRAQYIHSPTERRDWSLQAIDTARLRAAPPCTTVCTTRSHSFQTSRDVASSLLSPTDATKTPRRTAPAACDPGTT